MPESSAQRTPNARSQVFFYDVYAHTNRRPGTTTTKLRRNILINWWEVIFSASSSQHTHTRCPPVCEKGRTAATNDGERAYFFFPKKEPTRIFSVPPLIYCRCAPSLFDSTNVVIKRVRIRNERACIWAAHSLCS